MYFFLPRTFATDACAEPPAFLLEINSWKEKTKALRLCSYNGVIEKSLKLVITQLFTSENPILNNKTPRKNSLVSFS